MTVGTLAADPSLKWQDATTMGASVSEKSKGHHDKAAGEQADGEGGDAPLEGEEAGDESDRADEEEGFGEGETSGDSHGEVRPSGEWGRFVKC